MLPRRYIEEWREIAPWAEDAQVEQDLIIEKALLELFSDPFLRERLAFRGGTALHKLFLKPQVRYFEDIDLVQTAAEPIKDTISAIRKRLSFPGKPVIKQKTNNNTMVYRFNHPAIGIIYKVPRDFPVGLHLGEISYRFNHRDQNLYPLIFRMLHKTEMNIFDQYLVQFP